MKTVSIDFYPEENVIILDFTNGKISPALVVGQLIKRNNCCDFTKTKIACVFDRKCQLPREVSRERISECPHFSETVLYSLYRDYMHDVDTKNNKMYNELLSLGNSFLVAAGKSLAEHLVKLKNASEPYINMQATEVFDAAKNNTPPLFRNSSVLMHFSEIYRQTRLHTKFSKTMDEAFSKALVENDLSLVIDSDILLCDYSFAFSLSNYDLCQKQKAFEVSVHLPFLSDNRSLMYSEKGVVKSHQQLFTKTKVYISEFDLLLEHIDNYWFSRDGFKYVFIAHKRDFSTPSAKVYDQCNIVLSRQLYRSVMEACEEDKTELRAALEIPFSYMMHKKEYDDISLTDEVLDEILRSNKTSDYAVKLFAGEHHSTDVYVVTWGNSLLYKIFDKFIQPGTLVNWFGDILSLSKASNKAEQYFFINVKTNEEVTLDAGLYLLHVKNGFVTLVNTGAGGNGSDF